MSWVSVNGYGGQNNSQEVIARTISSLHTPVLIIMQVIIKDTDITSITQFEIKTFIYMRINVCSLTKQYILKLRQTEMYKKHYDKNKK